MLWSAYLLELERHGVMSKERFDPGMDRDSEGARRPVWTAGGNAPNPDRTVLDTFTYPRTTRSSDVLS